MEIINQSLQDFKLGYASSSEGRDFLYPVLNEIDEYATITQWDNASSLYSITYQTSNDDNFVVTTTAPVLEIGRIGANYHSGDIKFIRFTDQTPLQGISAMAGDGISRYAQIPEITLAGNFEIEFWWERRDYSGTQFAAILGQSDPVNDSILFFDSNHPSAANVFQFRVNDIGYNIAGALAGINQGQDIHVRIRREVGTIELFIDNISKGTLLGRTESVTYNQILRFDDADIGGANTGPLGQLIIRDSETGQVWDYANRNDSGNVLENQSKVDRFGADEAKAKAGAVTGTGADSFFVKDGNYLTINVTRTGGSWAGWVATFSPDTLYRIEFSRAELSGGTWRVRDVDDATNTASLTGGPQIVDIKPGGQGKISIEQTSGVDGDTGQFTFTVRRIHSLATAEGPELWDDGASWVPDGIFRKIGSVYEIENDDVNYDGIYHVFSTSVGELYRVRWTKEEGSGVGINISGAASNELLNDYSEEVYYFATAETMKIYFHLATNAVGATGRFSNVSIQKVTHGLWYENGVAMTPAAADAARTDLPLINQEWIFTTPGEIFEVYSGQQATLFGIDASNWQ